MGERFNYPADGTLTFRDRTGRTVKMLLESIHNISLASEAFSDMARTFELVLNGSGKVTLQDGEAEKDVSPEVWEEMMLKGVRNG